MLFLLLLHEFAISDRCHIKHNHLTQVNPQWRCEHSKGSSRSKMQRVKTECFFRKIQDVVMNSCCEGTPVCTRKNQAGTIPNNWILCSAVDFEAYPVYMVCEFFHGDVLSLLSMVIGTGYKKYFLLCWLTSIPGSFCKATWHRIKS